MDDRHKLVEMSAICKHYPGVQALDEVNLCVNKGEIRALVGENGAGKSTLIRILTGAELLTSGEIRIDGRQIDRMTPAISERLGIACVYQNLILAEHLTVAENVWMGRFPSVLGLVSKRELILKTGNLLSEIGYGGQIDPSAQVKRLSGSQQGMVAIVRAISRQARIIVFDEPTAVLADREVEELFRVIRQLKKKQLAIIYISHRLEEIFHICDTITVLKDGRNAGEAVTSRTTTDRLISMMVGRELSQRDYDGSRRRGRELLRAEGITNRHVSNCSLTVRAGEIVGIYGLVGAGRTELSRALIGRDRITQGRILLGGEIQKISSPRRAIDLGMSLVPEDRRRHGLALQLSVAHNLNLPLYRKQSVLGLIHPRKERDISEQTIHRLAIRTPSRRQRVKHLSGGNQQKVVVGKWLASKSHLFILDEPTNGIDVGAKEEIYALINRLAHEGSGVIWISSYMPELMSICDRILVMNMGRIVANVDRPQFDEERLLSLAMQTGEAAP